MSESYYEHEAQHIAGLRPSGGKMPPSLPAGPEWEDGEPVNLAAAAEDADLWLAFLQTGRSLEPIEAVNLAECRTALRRLFQPGR